MVHSTEIRICCMRCYFASVATLLLTGCVLSAQSNRIETFAGPPLPKNGDQATNVWFDSPSAVVSDRHGGFYFASLRQSRIYHVDSTGQLSVVAGRSRGFSGDGGPATLAQIANPTSLALDSQGNLYFADTGTLRMRKIDSQGIITTVGGNGTEGFSGDGGPATLAQFSTDALGINCFASCGKGLGIAVDRRGNLYIADTKNNRIRRVDSNGVITTVAGDGRRGSTGDGLLATAAQLSLPLGVATDSVGNLYIADTGNRRVRKVDLNGIMSTVAGTSLDPGLGLLTEGIAATAANLSAVEAVTLDEQNRLYISQRGQIEIVDALGTIHTIARRTNAISLDADTSGNIYYADSFPGTIRKLTLQGGDAQVVAGRGSVEGFSGDGGPANRALLRNPYGMAVDSEGNVYIADTGNQRIRKVSPEGIISTVTDKVHFPWHLATDASGNIYVADLDNVYRFTPAGDRQVLATAQSTGLPPPGGSDTALSYALSVAAAAEGTGLR
jgi:sugar lactone lactonase YvrE